MPGYYLNSNPSSHVLGIRVLTCPELSLVDEALHTSADLYLFCFSQTANVDLSVVLHLCNESWSWCC